MTETKPNVPDEVIKQALNATDLLEPEYTEDLDEAIRTAAPIIATWARQQALEEAVQWVEGTYTNPDGGALSRAWTGGVDAAAQRLRALVKGEA